MTAINAVTDYALDGDVGVITLNSPPVNALSFNVRDGLAGGMAAALADPGAKAIVIVCEGRTFIAGADITESAARRRGASLFDVQDAMENSTKPVVAAIHGTALGWRPGGGALRALSRRRPLGALRPAGSEPRPAAGRGRHTAATAHRRPAEGAGDDDLRRARAGQGMPGDGPGRRAGRRGRSARRRGRLRPQDRRRRPAVEEGARVEREGGGRPRPPREIFENFRKANARKFRGFLAPEYNIRCIEAAVNQPFEEGLRTERKLFGELMSGSQSAAQRYAFFAERQPTRSRTCPTTPRPFGEQGRHHRRRHHGRRASP